MDFRTAISGNSYVTFFDKDYNVISDESIGSPTIGSISKSINDTVVAGASGFGAPREGCIVRWDKNLVKSTDYYTPVGGWSYYNDCYDVCFTPDGKYLYYFGFYNLGPDHLIKFDETTGSEIWRVVDPGALCYAIRTDLDGNVYSQHQVGDYYYAKRSKIDGSILMKYPLGEYAQDLWIDESVDRIVAVGCDGYHGSPVTQIAVCNCANTHFVSYTIFDNTAYTIYGVRIIGNYIYGCGTRTPGSGIGGVLASVWKWDLDLNLLASYDTGDRCWSCWQDATGNIVVNGGVTTDTIYVLDSNLNFVASYTGFTFAPGNGDGFLLPYGYVPLAGLTQLVIGRHRGGFAIGNSKVVSRRRIAR